jgi:hypothetical protein
VVTAEGVSGVVYKVGKVYRCEWGGRSRWRRCGEGGGSVGGGVEGGEVSGGARVWTHSATSVTEEVCVAPPQRSISQGGIPAGLELGSGWVEVALARCRTMGRPYLDNTIDRGPGR